MNDKANDTLELAFLLAKRAELICIKAVLSDQLLSDQLREQLHKQHQREQVGRGSFVMRRILTKIQLDRIAAVDNPAQEHALVTLMKRRPKKQQADPDDDNDVEDDWSVNAPRKKKQPKGWSREDIDKVQPKLEHPFMRRARALSQKHKVPLYLGMSAARREDPASHRHFVQSGIAASQPKPIKKAAPDDVALAWDAAVRTWSENYGLSRCDAMTQIRKQAPQLWARYRRWTR